MAILSWMNLGVCALLAVTCVALYLDARGARQALRALQRATATHDRELCTVRRALATLGPRTPEPALFRRMGRVSAPSPAAGLPPPVIQRAAARRARLDPPAPAEVAEDDRHTVEVPALAVLPPPQDAEPGEDGGGEIGDLTPFSEDASARLQRALAEGVHCGSEACSTGAPSADVCACACDRCATGRATLVGLQGDTPPVIPGGGLGL